METKPHSLRYKRFKGDLLGFKENWRKIYFYWLRNEMQTVIEIWKSFLQMVIDTMPSVNSKFETYFCQINMLQNMRSWSFALIQA